MEKQVFESNIGFSYKKAILDSGLTVYVMEKQGNSNYVIFGTRYGSIDMVFESNGERTELPDGIAHYLEHKLFESEEGDAFSLYAKTGASANAYTSFDRTCYLFSCANNFYQNFEILLNLVGTPYFTEQTVQKEQGIIGQEIRMYDDSPSWRVLFNMLENMYHNHPVKTDIAGTVESIAKIDYKLLYKCYETFYDPSNMFICVSGDVDAEKIFSMVESKVPAGKRAEVKVIDPQEPNGIINSYVEQKLEVLVPMFCLGFKQNITEPFVSLKTKICVSLLLEMLVGDSSPLYAKLLKSGLINDDFECEYFTGRNYAAVLFEGESYDPVRVEQEIKEEIERLKAEGLDKKLFSAVKCGLYGDAVRRFDSVESIVSGFTECAMNKTELFDEIKLLKSVTADDVYRHLDIFCADNSVLSVIKPLKE